MTRSSGTKMKKQKDSRGCQRDRRGIIHRETGEPIQAWHYRLSRSQPMIKWSQSRSGTLNGLAYVFAITKGQGRAYAYFQWDDELLFFCTGAEPLRDDETINYVEGADTAL